ncbi:MAG: hypothetical protein ACOC4I_00115 [Spirochaetota bacterium]
MKVVSHLSLEGFSNTYVIASDDNPRCIVVDPGSMDADLLTVFLKNGIEPGFVLVTRAEKHHTAGLSTMQKVYQPIVYGHKSLDPAVDPQEQSAGNDPAENLVEYRRLDIPGFEVRAITFPGAWIDGTMYIVGDVLFPGPMLSAGGLREVDAGYPRALLIEALTTVFSSLPKSTWIFPAYGPPTTIQVELRSNPSLLRPVEHHVLEETD